MESRLSDYWDIWNSLPDKSAACLTVRGLLKDIKLTSWIGSGLFGDVYGGKMRESPKTSPLSNVTTLKKSRKRVKTYQVIVKTAYASKPHTDEASLSKNISMLVSNRIAPNFPLSYGYYTCRNVKFKGKRGRGVYKAPGEWNLVKTGKGLIQISEYSGIPFSEYLDTKPTAAEFSATIAQVLIGVYCLRKHLKINHGDLYFNNIVMNKVDKPCVFKYIINGKKYNIKVDKYYPVLIDYGQSSDIREEAGSEDLFNFLTDFCVASDGTRPRIDKRNRIKFSYDLPRATKTLLTHLLGDILYHFDDIPYDAPFKHWMRSSYTTGDKLLKKHFLKKYSREIKNIKNIVFKV